MGTKILCLMCIFIELGYADESGNFIKEETILKNIMRSENNVITKDLGSEALSDKDGEDYTIDIKGNLGDSKLYDDCATTLTIQGSVKDSRLFAHSTSRKSMWRSFFPFLKPKKPIIVPCQQTFLHEGNLHDRIIIHSDMIHYEGINVFLKHLISLCGYRND